MTAQRNAAQVTVAHVAPCWRDRDTAPPGDYVDPITAAVWRRTEERWYRVYHFGSEEGPRSRRVFGPIPYDEAGGPGAELMGRVAALALCVVLALGCATSPPTLGPSVFEPSRTPVKPVPADRWGELRPWRILKDTTWLRGEPGDTARFHDLAISGDYLFTATGQGMETYDVTDPDRPRIVSYADGSALAPVWGFSDKNFFLTSVDVAGDELVVTGAEDFGLIVWNTRAKGRPEVHYQDDTEYVRSVAVVKVNGKRLAFGASNSALLAYDLDAAARLDRCVERDGCPGVKIGVLATGSASALVSAWDRWVVYRDGLRIRIYDADPATVSDFLRLSAILTGVTAAGEASGWEYRGRLYLAVAVANAARSGELWVYDVSCIRHGACALGEPVKYSTPDLSAPVQPLNVDLSFSADGTPYIYVGTNVVGMASRPVCVAQREYLFEARDVRALRGVTPRAGPYWGWYYEPCYGFNETAPRHAVLWGDVIYRTAYSFLDSHALRRLVLFEDGFETGDTSRWGR